MSYASKSKMRCSRFWCALPFAVIFAACSDDGLVQVHPRIVVEPESLDFGEGVVGAENLGQILVLNRGQAVLSISSATIEPAGAYRVVSFPEVLSPTTEMPLVLSFVPVRAHETYASDLVIRSNDPERGELRVPLTGAGGVREIEVFPTDVDFGIVNEGTAPRRAIEIRNIGKDVLSIDRLTFTSTSIDLALAPGTFLSGDLGPGTSTVVEVVYSPVDLAGDRATLTIFSNDEDEPETVVNIRGYANLAPRAIAWGCPPMAGRIGCENAADRARSFSAGLRQRLNLDGRESFDPEGGPVTNYRWQLVTRPTGSNAAVFHSTDDRNLRMRATGDLEIDVVGTFELLLIVRDERGLDSLDRPESRITIRPKDLEVLLRWDLPTDVDLHLVRPGGRVGDYGTGAAGTSTGSDASTFNRRPNWSDLASSTDDPSLDIDDVSGRGPEVISLDRPIDGGVYEAFVHYCDSRNIGVVTGVTVEVYVRGERVAQIPTEPEVFRLAPGEVWQGALIRWIDDPQRPSVEVQDGLQNAPVMDPSLCRAR